MYSTSVGLVLAGFKAIDERENRYAEFEVLQAGNKVLRKDKQKDVFTNLLDRAKSFLIDDYDDKSDY